MRQVQEEAPFRATTLPQLPRLIHNALSEDRGAPLQKQLELLHLEQLRLRRSLWLITALLALSTVLTATLFWLR